MELLALGLAAVAVLVALVALAQARRALQAGALALGTLELLASMLKSSATPRTKDGSPPT